MDSNSNISSNLFKQSIRIALKAFVLQRGWELHFDSSQPKMSFESNTIHLPPLDDQVTTEMETLIWGFVHHELGHVNFTDSTADTPEQPIYFALFNAIEDGRMENRVMLQYPGIKVRLDKLVELLVASSFFGKPSAVRHPIQLLQTWVLYTLRSRFLLQTALDEYATIAEENLFGLIGEATSIRLRTCLMKITASEATTQDSVNIALELIKILKEEIEDEEKEPPKDLSPKTSPSDSGNASPSRTTMKERQSIKEMLDASNSDLDKNLGDLGEAISDSITIESKKPENQSNYREYDLLVPSGGSNPVLYKEAMDGIFGLAARLKNLLYSPTRRRKRNRLSGSRIDTRSIYKAALGDHRVFIKKTVSQGVDTDLVILLDASSSMKTTEMDIAKKAALAANSVLDSIKGVSVCSAAFCGRNNVIPLSRFGDNVLCLSENFNISSQGYTPMTQGINWALEQLSISNSPRKQMIIITDGGPDDVNSTKKVIKLAIASGVEVLGIGIGSDYIQKLIPSSKAIHSSSELSNAIFELFRNTRVAV